MLVEHVPCQTDIIVDPLRNVLAVMPNEDSDRNEGFWARFVDKIGEISSNQILDLAKTLFKDKDGYDAAPPNVIVRSTDRILDDYNVPKDKYRKLPDMKLSKRDQNFKSLNNSPESFGEPPNRGKSKSRKSTYRNGNGPNLTIFPGKKIEEFTFESFEDNSVDSTSLFLMNGRFFDFTVDDSNYSKSFAYEEFKNIIYAYKFVIQERTNYDIDRNLTDNQLKEYISIVINALEIYFFITSVIEFVTDNINGNSGILYIRRQINANDLQDLKLLKDQLERMYLNPKLVSFIKDMYSNYSSNSAYDSPIIKLCPNNLFLDDLNNEGKFVSGSTISGIVDKLSKMVYLSSQFKKIGKDWKIDLTNFDAKKKFSSDFLSFWHNCSIKYSGTAKFDLLDSRVVNSVKDDLYIGIFANRIKPVYMPSIAIKVDELNCYQCGLYMPCSYYPDAFEYYNRISLHVYDSKLGIVGIKSDNDTDMSFVYATPFVDVDGNHAVKKNKFMTKNDMKLSLQTLRKYVHAVMNYLFMQ